MKRAIVVGLSGLGVVVAGLLAWVTFFSKPATPSPLTGPNGYEECLKAGRAMSPGTSRLEDLKPEELRAFVSRNAESLGQARAAMERDCRVPPAYSLDSVTNHMSGLGVFKRLAVAFVAEGKLAEQESRFADACNAHLDAIQLGHSICRDGAIIDVLVGLGCQGIGSKALTGLRSHLLAVDCRGAIARLERMDAAAVSAADMLENERSWRRRVYGWRGALIALVTYRSLRQVEQGATTKLQTQRRETRRLVIDLAVRAYELEKGQPPRGAADLVPAYLTTVPVDPATGAALPVVP